MKLTSGFLGMAAAVQSVVAIPFMSFESADLVASAPVNSLACNGDTYQCTAGLMYGNGQWAAQWGAAIFHTGLFGAPDHTETIRNMARGTVRVTHLACDGERYKCTANLDYGDGKWVAQWGASVGHPTGGRVMTVKPSFLRQ